MNALNRVNDSHYIYLQKRADDILLFESNSGEQRKIGELKIEWDVVIGKFIKSSIPSEAEIEAAINYIEDELMKDLSLVNSQGLNLYTDDSELIGLLQRGLEQSEFSKEDIEREFTRYAFLSMGSSPITTGIEMDQQRYIALLVVREILHHLDFASLKLVA